MPKRHPCEAFLFLYGRIMDWIQLGVVGRPVGLAGEFQLSGRKDSSVSLPLKVNLLAGKGPGVGKLYQLEKLRNRSRSSVMKLSSLNSREDLESIKGLGVWVRRQDLELDSESEYLWHNLIGRGVFDSNSLFFGEIRSVNNYGASDIVTIKGESGSVDLPFVDYYFDMGFGATEGPIFMSVEASIFDDLWY